MTKRSAGPDDMEFGRALRKARIGEGLTQAELAERLDISPQQYSKNERGLNRIPTSRWSDLVRILPSLKPFLAGMIERNVEPGFAEGRGAAYDAGPAPSIEDKLKTIRPEMREAIIRLIDAASSPAPERVRRRQRPT